MVKGLANANAATIVGARADQPFASVDDLWRRAGVPSAALVQLAEADAFRPSLKLARREALWEIKALRDEPLPLFAAASARASEIVPEVSEPAVSLKPMTAGGEVVEDYGHVGLSLRRHPVSFLRQDLHEHRIVTCAEAMEARDGRRLEAAGLVLVRQRPGSAKGVMFITIEDETGIANLVVWPKVFETFRRVVLSAGMLAVRGRIQREGEVVHLVAQQLTDLSDGSCERRRARCVVPVTARPRRQFPSWVANARSAWTTEGLADAGHLHPGSAHRHDQGEDAGFSVSAGGGLAQYQALSKCVFLHQRLQSELDMEPECAISMAAWHAICELLLWNGLSVSVSEHIMSYPRQFEMQNKTRAREVFQIGTMIADSERVVQLLDADIIAAEQRSGSAISRTFAYPVIARNSGRAARKPHRDDLNADVQVVEVGCAAVCG